MPASLPRLSFGPRMIDVGMVENFLLCGAGDGTFLGEYSFVPCLSSAPLVFAAVMHAREGASLHFVGGCEFGAGGPTPGAVAQALGPSAILRGSYGCSSRSSSRTSSPISR